MTEAEWLRETDPTPMLELLQSKASDRKLRLSACAGCRMIWGGINQEAFRRAVAVGEQVADGIETDDVRQKALDDANDFVGLGAKACRLCVHPDAFTAARDGLHSASASSTPLGQLSFAQLDMIQQGVKVRQAVILRDVFGNPSRPVTVNPASLTSTVVALARQMYDSRDFSVMPILADALQDAGCEDADILTHCRGDGPHVRGCWVVDLLLGKE